MERELEALAARPARPAEPPFQALVEAAGGCGQVLLVGELWEREQSRALLWDFARAVFPPQRAAGKPGGAAAEGAEPGAPGAQKALRTGAARAIRSPLVFVLCRASSLAAREPRRHLREMLRDVRGRRRAGAALVGVLVAEAEAEDSVVPELRLLEALLRTVFGRQAGGPVQAVAYCPGHPASSLAVQAAACRALQAAGPARPGEEARGPGGRRRAAGGGWGKAPTLELFRPAPSLYTEQKEPGTDLASQHCWHAFPGVPGAGGRTQMPPPSVAQLRITSRTLRRSWH
ncbi:uncharacterized protein C2orf72 isoform X3 [Camelus bactrianus]|uniref:Uncharacterized protein C2orf72 isoform X3 n=1 Tax=Camelus bactrianus TaxID=9837 RepID=A0AC58QE61_CAMBA